ncbi:MAG: GrpB family protein [Ruminococcaceae bacterium]|nr:GrpB family protein [Oscillospiraceae bacterium]
MLGLKRDTVKLLPHQKQWSKTAKDTILKLKALLGSVAIDIQHIGSTAIHGIYSKPIIDIAVGVDNLESINPYIDLLEQNGIMFRNEDVPGQLLFVIGDDKCDIITHHIHIVIWNSTAWHNYINFRDYLNAFPAQAKVYELVKKELALKFAGDRQSYTAGKQELIDTILKQAQLWRDE